MIGISSRWRLSRPCYDKPYRCPGWAGPGLRYPKVVTCGDGLLDTDQERRTWQWRFYRCESCGIVTLPQVVRYLDVENLREVAGWKWRRWRARERK